MELHSIVVGSVRFVVSSFLQVDGVFEVLDDTMAHNALFDFLPDHDAQVR
jgi:hypothetical protein